MQIDPRLTAIDDCLYRFAIRALIFHEGKVLLVHEKYEDWWGFPGGGIDYDEDISQAISRELAEELGVSTSKIKTNDRIVHVAIGAIVNGVPRVNLFYRVEIPVDSISTTDDSLGFSWFMPAELNSKIISRYAGSSVDDGTRLVKVIESQSLQ